MKKKHYERKHPTKLAEHLKSGGKRGISQTRNDSQQQLQIINQHLSTIKQIFSRQRISEVAGQGSLWKGWTTSHNSGNKVVS